MGSRSDQQAWSRRFGSQQLPSELLGSFCILVTLCLMDPTTLAFVYDHMVLEHLHLHFGDGQADGRFHNFGFALEAFV